MVKSVLGVNHQGLRDWAIQRASAILMAIYSIGLVAYLLCNPGLSFAEWHTLFSHTWMKVATILFLVSILFHAWVGMWTIFTDYVHSFPLRTILHALVLLLLAACFIWGILILWSV
ncbi:succinate dehydrogenase, hydrophobic membrane anchor protein [Aquicella lusitana]|uniref:Succinate dehydrogenase hydrophobic membrane anchor subunit n=1 Tax=Aquicella lusitana TaxID=254246 RepID=A0A370GGD2_9COXI|nr:succinate dehydrogenase, hydrophobic membrane anchor protein [Aquicella lusitana]RDI42727.1 succinate dehydrogenase subunit D [Aquicella lusitana]VVC73418.1 Succinate dehydrogenase hydrophobic membrane anchor subunit [Aquicella lusitana]